MQVTWGSPPPFCYLEYALTGHLIRSTNYTHSLVPCWCFSSCGRGGYVMCFSRSCIYKMDLYTGSTWQNSCDYIYNVCVFLSPERVVSFLSRPVLPAALLPSSQELFSANAICQWVFPNTTLISALLISMEVLNICISTDICLKLVGKRSLMLAGSSWNGKRQNCRSESAAKEQWMYWLAIFAVRSVYLKSGLFAYCTQQQDSKSVCC